MYTSYLFGLPDTAKNDMATTVDSSNPVTVYLHGNSPSYHISLKSVLGLLCVNNYTVEVRVGPPVTLCRYPRTQPSPKYSMQTIKIVLHTVYVLY